MRDSILPGIFPVQVPTVNHRVSIVGDTNIGSKTVIPLVSD